MTRPALLSQRSLGEAVGTSDEERRLHGWRGFRQRMIVSRRGSRLLVLICLMVSLWAFNYAVKFEQLQAQYEFRKLTLSSVGNINQHIGNYAQALAGTAAHIGVKAQVRPDTLQKYVAGLDLGRNAPGISAFGFIPAVRAQDTTIIERAPDSQHGLTLQVKPVAAGLERFVVTHITPELEKSPLAELIQAGDEDLRTGLGTARRMRETIVIKPALQGAAAVELLMVRAVFTARSREGTPEDVFMGWAVIAFNMQDILDGLTAHFGDEYDLSLFQIDAVGDPVALFSTVMSSSSSGVSSESYPIETYGNRWLLRFVSTPGFDAAYSSYSPHTLLALGLLFTLLVSSALKSTALRHRSLKSMAELRTRQLGAQEEENRSLLETSVSVVMVLNDQGQITFANEGAATLFECAPAELEGCDFTYFVTLDGGERQFDLCNAVGRPAQGEQLMLDVQTNTWRTVDGTIHTTVLIRDVTEQINGRKAIEALNQRYEIALTGAGIGIFEIDTVTDEMEMSETWHRMTGTDFRTDPFERKQDFIKRVHPDDLNDVVTAYRQCITGGALRSIVEFRVEVNGRWRWMYSNAVPVARDADGRATKLIGAQTDITDLREARNALELSEARFRMVLEDAPLGMAVMNEVGTFIGVNAALARLSGYDVNALHKKMRLAELLLRKDFVMLSHDVRNLLKSGETKTYQNQFQLRTRSGELRWGLFNLSWTYDSRLGENVYIAQIVDITDQKKVEQIKSEFVSTVSHELRTPLTSIKGALGLLGVTVADTLPDNANRLLDIASVNADRLTALVNDILDLEKISSGDVVFEFEAVTLQAIIAQTLDDMNGLAAQQGNRLLMGSDDADLQVHVDVGRMRQVLSNLVSNACKFSDEDTPVVVSVKVQGDMAAIYVENIGPPVPESFQAQLFEAFTQVDGSDTRSMGGTGLGLNIARQIVMRLGGRIGFEQRSERRTVFWFTCPLADEAVFEVPIDPARSHG